MATKRKSSEDGDRAKPVKVRKLSFSEEIVVVVGAEQKRYTAPKELLSKNSPFFRTASNNRWNKTEGKPVINLPKENSEIFERYLQYVYTGEIVLFDPEEKSTKPGERYRMLLDLYLLADYLQDLRACNAISDRWLELDRRTFCTPDQEIIIQAFRSLPSTNPLYRLCIAQVCNSSDRKAYLKYLNAPDWPVDANKELLLHWYRLQHEHPVQDAWDFHEETDCRFHEHNDECPPCKQKDVAKE